MAAQLEELDREKGRINDEIDRLTQAGLESYNTHRKILECGSTERVSVVSDCSCCCCYGIDLCSAEGGKEAAIKTGW